MGYRSDIVIITALREEFEEFRKAFVDFTDTNLVQVEDDPFVFKGRLPQKHNSFLIFAAHQPEAGIISASVLATRMIDRYLPRYLVMLGIAAGLQKPGVDYGDVLIAKYVSHYQEGKVFSGGVVKKNRVGYMLERELNMMFQDRKDVIMDWISDRRGRKYRSHLGVILTGSQVVADAAFMAELDNEQRKVVGVEMEGVAIFQAASEARSNSKPKAILIKGVSDFGTDTKTDEFQRLAASNSALFFLRFALDHLEPAAIASEPGWIEMVPWLDLDNRGEGRLIRELDRCDTGSEIRLVSITSASLLAPRETSTEVRHTLMGAFGAALARGARCRAILLDPDSEEAECRSLFESPGRRNKRRRLLIEDSYRVREMLPENWKSFADGRFQLAYSAIGLPFNLWLFENIARIEPYHFGKRRPDRDKPESPLCGFAQLWFRQEAPEYDVLLDHFNNLWSRSQLFFPEPKKSVPRRR